MNETVELSLATKNCGGGGGGADAIGDFVIFSVDNDAIRSMHAVSERTSAKSGARLDN